MNDSFFEKTIAQYEFEFVNGSPPNLQDYVQRLDLGSNFTRSDLFYELLHTDLEMRIRNGHKARVEQYVRQFPEIARSSDLIEDLVRTEFKVRRQYEPGLTVDEYSARFPEHFNQLVDGFFLNRSTGSNSTVNNSNRSSITGMGASDSRRNSFSDEQRRFRKCYLHQRGGLGNIWLAFDRELGQAVAIKEIKPKYLSSAAHRSRFAREALVTSQLDHPGIVSVYGMGQRIDGAPYFAMQFIRGRTLRAAIKEFHADGKSHAGARSLEFRRLIQHFLDVCNTVHYAHTQLVVHRDIKPENIMIGQFGETFVIDWGLAKANFESQFDQLVPDDTVADVADSLKMMLNDASGKSVDGTRIGSLGFMSPEQLAGNRDSLGPHSDVFSLGATLYCLIANEDRPVPNQLGEIDENYAPPVFNVAAGHKQLRSICRKAMAREAGDRYATAAELAEDVENFLLDRPVVAHRDSLIERAGRVSRRYRTVLNTALVGLLVLSILSLLAIASINHERELAVASGMAEVVQRIKAERRTEQLTDTVGIFANLFSGADSRGVGVILEEITLEDALNDLDSQIAGQADPIVKMFLHAVLARNSINSGKAYGAISHYESALKQLRQNEIAETDPLHLATTVGLCRSLANAGVDGAEAINKLDRVIEICRTRQLNCDETLFEALLVKAGMLLHNDDNAGSAEARAVVFQANSLGEKIYADDPKNIELLEAKLLAAELLIHQGKPEEFFESYSQLINDWKSQYPLHSQIIFAQVRLAEFEVQNHRLPQAVKRLKAAVRDAVELFGDDHPSTMSIRSRYASMLVFGQHFGEEEKIEGVNILRSCRARQLQQGDYFAALKSTCALVKGLLLIGGFENETEVITVCDEFFAMMDDAPSIPFAAKLQVLNLDLSRVYYRHGKVESAIDAVSRSILYSDQVYGKDSDKSVALQQERQRLKQHGVGQERSLVSKSFTRRVAKLILAQPGVEHLLGEYQDFKQAWQANSFADRPTSEAMYFMTKELASAHEEAGDVDQALDVFKESLNFANLTFGEGTRPCQELARQIKRLQSKVNAQQNE